MDSQNNQNNGLGGVQEDTYIVLMHLSQFAGFLIPGLGFLLPIVLWLVKGKDYPNIDKHGKKHSKLYDKYDYIYGYSGCALPYNNRLSNRYTNVYCFRNHTNCIYYCSSS